MSTPVHNLPAGIFLEPVELSIVIPTLNEALTVTPFVQWCQEGIAAAKIKAQILIVDSSTDATAALALAAGAEVLQVPKRGLGQAYQDALPFIRGPYVLMGDADCTYDFRELGPFLASFRGGHEFVMGSRFRGYIEAGAMPALHRYFGNPLTTLILNSIYRSRFTDIHCGMRGLTLAAFRNMRLQSTSWEYASEMVLKSVQMKLRTDEVPVRFYKDQDGRLSHHRRSGWFSPWQAGWINLRAMLVHGAEVFSLWPGILIFFLGLCLTIPLTFGPLRLGFLTFSIFWMLLGVQLTIIGLQSFYMGCIACILHDYQGRSRLYWVQLFSYNRSVLLSGVLVISGIALVTPLCVDYWRHNFRLPEPIGAIEHGAITGLLLISLGFMNFIFTLVLNSLDLALKERDSL